MEKLKQPEMFLSVVNSAGIAGLAIYFHKQLELIRAGHEKLFEFQVNLKKKLDALEKSSETGKEVIKNLNMQVKTINDELFSIQDVLTDVDDIIETLKDHDIEVEKVAPPPPPPKKRGGRARETDTDTRSRKNAPKAKTRQPDSDDDLALIEAARASSQESEFLARR